MTVQEYKATVFRNLEGGYAAPDSDVEPYFSRQSCDLCDSYLGGMRHTMHVIAHGKDVEPYQVEVCTDCLFYTTYDELPEHLEEEEERME